MTDILREARPLRKDPALPFVILVAGLVLLATVTWFEVQNPVNRTWRDAVIAVENQPPWDNLIEISFRRLPDDSFFGPGSVAAEAAYGPGWKELAEKFGWYKNEAILSLSIPEKDWEALLASGRLPEPGKPEVLGGDLTRWDVFVMDGVTFEEVGRINRGNPVFTFAYALPDHEAVRPFFSEERGGKKAWLAPDGLARLAQEEFSLERAKDLKLAGGIARTTPALALGTVAGLMLVALGGVLIQLRFFHWLSARPQRVFAPIFRDMAQHRLLLWTLHGLCYGLWFSWMLVAREFPLTNMRLMQLVRITFSEGDLSYIGTAYASGDIWMATLATFFHNYVVQTLALTIIPSFIIPFWGLLKNLLSFMLIGFAMAPIWIGISEGYIYHSITMVVELEGYILASFMVTRLPIRCFKGFFARSFWSEYLSGLRVIASGTLLVGIILAVAALYEAATLIALH